MNNYSSVKIRFFPLIIANLCNKHQTYSCKVETPNPSVVQKLLSFYNTNLSGVCIQKSYNRKRVEFRNPKICASSYFKFNFNPFYQKLLLIKYLSAHYIMNYWCANFTIIQFDFRFYSMYHKVVIALAILYVSTYTGMEGSLYKYLLKGI